MRRNLHILSLGWALAFIGCGRDFPESYATVSDSTADQKSLYEATVQQHAALDRAGEFGTRSRPFDASADTLGGNNQGVRKLSDDVAHHHGLHINPCPPWAGYGTAFEWWSGRQVVADTAPGGHDWDFLDGHLYVYHFGNLVYASPGGWCWVP